MPKDIPRGLVDGVMCMRQVKGAIQAIQCENYNFRVNYLWVNAVVITGNETMEVEGVGE